MFNDLKKLNISDWNNRKLLITRLEKRNMFFPEYRRSEDIPIDRIIQVTFSLADIYYRKRIFTSENIKYILSLLNESPSMCRLHIHLFRG